MLGRNVTCTNQRTRADDAAPCGEQVWLGFASSIIPAPKAVDAVSSTPPPGPGDTGDQPGWGQQPSYGQPQYGQQPAYGQPYGYGVGMTDHPQGTTILVLGILSLVVCQLLGPVAWIMGNNALKEIDANPSRYANRGNVQGGRICGIIASALMTVVAVFVLIAIIAAAGASSSN